MWNLKITQMTLYTKQKQTHRYRKQTDGYLTEEKGEGQYPSVGLASINYYT